jgi:hypothetical protein
LIQLDEKKIQLEEKAIGSFKPSASLPLNNNTSAVKPIVTSDTPIENEGYLFKRGQAKSPMLVPVWSRRWCYIKDGKFGYRTVAKQRVSIAFYTDGRVELFAHMADRRAWSRRRSR